MKDGTRELTNNQWLLKADADKLPATYAELVTLLTGAGLPFGRTLLSDGWTIEPDPLNKANLLTDATAALYGLTSAAMVDDVLTAIRALTFDAASFAANGYAKIGTFIIQWGTNSCARGGTDITLPIAFPNGFLCGVASSGSANYTVGSFGVYSGTTTTVSVGYYSSSDFSFVPIRWIAVGY